MGTFVISQRINELYKFEFVSRKGKTIFISSDFELRFECENEIEFLKKNIQKMFFMKFKSSNGKYYFKLIIDDREVAKSRQYSTQLLLEKSIEEIKKFVDTSEILDFSLKVDFFDEK